MREVLGLLNISWRLNCMMRAARTRSKAGRVIAIGLGGVLAVGTLSTRASAGLALSGISGELSPWSMFMAADRVVKGIMLVLALAASMTWIIWIAKSWEITRARQQLLKALALISEEHSLVAAESALREHRGLLPVLIAAAASELQLSADLTDKVGTKERVASRLRRIEAAAGRKVNQGTGILGTIGSTAPFVGLFGTVWGIMNSFIGISKAKTTNLAVVAPGIAEALLATAIGLFAAIPAVIIYNHFSRRISGYKALVADASAEVLRITSRELDRQGTAEAHQQASE